MPQSPQDLVRNNPNASIATLTGALVTVAAVISEDVFGYDPSSAAFWPAVATVLGAVVLGIGKRT